MGKAINLRGDVAVVDETGQPTTERKSVWIRVDLDRLSTPFPAYDREVFREEMAALADRIWEELDLPTGTGNDG